MANQEKIIRVIFAHPRSDETFEVEIGAQMTGQQAINELRRAEFLPDPGSEAFGLALGKRSLDTSRSLGEQGVTDGARIKVVLVTIGAA